MHWTLHLSLSLSLPYVSGLPDSLMTAAFEAMAISPGRFCDVRCAPYALVHYY